MVRCTPKKESCPKTPFAVPGAEGTPGLATRLALSGLRVYTSRVEDSMVIIDVNVIFCEVHS